MKLLVQELTWTKSQNPTFGQHRPYRKLRCSVYGCVECWIQVTKSLPEEGSVVAKLVQHVLDDVKPVTSQTKLLLTASNSGNQQLSKKAKKRKIQDDVDQLLTGQQKFDVNANEMITYRALKVLCTILIAGGSDIPREVVREIQVCVVKLVIQCQQSSFNSFPIPFSNAECRQGLYHVLLCCLLSNSPYVPSPVNHAVKLFSSGLQDIDLKVSSFCQEALAVANSIIHPRVFPQGCSAPKQLLFGTPENPSSNGPLSVDHESISESLSSYRENQMALSENVLSQRSLLFERHKLNGSAYSQIEQMSMEQTDYEDAAEGSNTGNTPLVDGTSGEQTEQFDTSGKENNTQKEKSHSEAVNPDSEMTETGLIASSNNTARGQLSNQEKCIQNTNQMSASENLSRKAAVSPQQLKNVHDSKNTVGLSEPKQRRTEDADLNTDREKQVESNKATFKPYKDQLTENITEKENVINEDSDSDETAQLLAAFVDSYPDSDEPEFG